LKARKQPHRERRTVAYTRVSTEEQAREGVSLAAQEARIAAYALALGWEVSEVISDAGASAKSLRRPGIDRVIAGIRAGEIDRLVILKLDRATRSTRDLATLLELFAAHGASLVSVSEHLDTASAAGRLVVNMLGVVAQWEREAIAERTSLALSHKRSQGHAYGPTPFGYRREGTELVEVAVEQEAIREARRMNGAGETYRAIARMLEERSVRPHRGQTWHASTVRAMLMSRIAQERATLGIEG